MEHLWNQLGRETICPNIGYCLFVRHFGQTPTNGRSAPKRTDATNVDWRSLDRRQTGQCSHIGKCSHTQIHWKKRVAQSPPYSSAGGITCPGKTRLWADGQNLSSTSMTIVSGNGRSNNNNISNSSGGSWVFVTNASAGKMHHGTNFNLKRSKQQRSKEKRWWLLIWGTFYLEWITLKRGGRQ